MLKRAGGPLKTGAVLLNWVMDAQIARSCWASGMIFPSTVAFFCCRDPQPLLVPIYGSTNGPSPRGRLASSSASYGGRHA